MMAFLNDIQMFQRKKLHITETILTQTDGKKINEKSGKVISKNSQKEFYVIDNSPDEKLHKVTEEIYIGSQDAAQNYEALKYHDITHILNAAVQCPNQFEGKFIYKNLEILDVPEFDISQHFEESTGFIKNALESGGKLLCHCNAGISRSSTLILAYLIQVESMSLMEGFELIRRNRPGARPNDGFLRRLKQLETENT